MTMGSIPTSLLVEPCALCDDDGTFDYKETDNITDLDDNKADYYDDSVLDGTVMKYYNWLKSFNGWMLKTTIKTGTTTFIPCYQVMSAQT